MDPIVIVLLVLMFALAFGIGANDETMATLVGSKSLKANYAILLGGVLASVGVVILSENVSRTIGENLLSDSVDYNNFMLFAIVISTTIWLVVASQTGAPISTTHSVVGSVFGVAIVWAFQGNSFLESMVWEELGRVALGWVLSPIFGLAGAVILKIVVNKIISKAQKGLERLEKIEKLSAILLIGVISWTQISRGGNDSANALGILYGLIKKGGEDGVFLEENVIFFLIGTGLMLGLGILIIGRKVIKNVGNSLLDLKPSDGLSIELSTSIVLFVCTILGLPVSGTHILVFAIIGAGLVQGERPDKKAFRKMLLSWIITFPVAAALSAIIYSSLYGIFL